MDFEDEDIESVASYSSGESTQPVGFVTTVDERQNIRRQFEENDPQLTVLRLPSWLHAGQILLPT